MAKGGGVSGKLKGVCKTPPSESIVLKVQETEEEEEAEEEWVQA